MIGRLMLAVSLSCGVVLHAAPARLEAQRRSSLLVGRVLADSNKAALAGAAVSIPTLGLETATDSVGRFRLDVTTSGRLWMFVRLAGYRSIRTLVEFSAGDSVQIDVSLSPARGDTSAIETVKVSEPTRPLQEFDRRRATGTGVYLTAEEIRRLSRGRLSEALRRLPGVNFATGAGGNIYLVGGRGTNSRTSSCFTAVMINGSWVYDGSRLQTPFSVNSILPDDIAALEFYRSLSNTPVELQGPRDQCGVLVIWTK